MKSETKMEAKCTGCNKVKTFYDKAICYVDEDGQPQVGTYSQIATDSGCEVKEVIFKDSEGEVIEEPTEWKDSGCPNGCIQAIPTKQCNTKESAEALVEVTTDTPLSVSVVAPDPMIVSVTSADVEVECIEGEWSTVTIVQTDGKTEEPVIESLGIKCSEPQPTVVTRLNCIEHALVQETVLVDGDESKVIDTVDLGQTCGYKCGDFQVVRAYNSKGECMTVYICKPSREWQDQDGNMLDTKEWSLCPPEPKVFNHVDCFMGFDQYLTEKDIIMGSESGEQMKFEITYKGNTETLIIDYALTSDGAFKSTWYKTLVDYLNGLDGITFELQSDVKSMEDSFSPIWSLTYSGSEPADFEIVKGGGASVFSWYFDGTGGVEHKTNWSGDAAEGMDSAPWRECKPL